MSWIIIDRKTKKVVCEVFDKMTIDKLDLGKYEYVDSYEYLAR